LHRTAKCAIEQQTFDCELLEMIVFVRLEYIEICRGNIEACSNNLYVPCSWKVLIR